MRMFGLILGAAVAVSAASPANATAIFADKVINFFDSGAGPLPGPYGGDSTSPKPVSTSYAADENAGTFVSLPTGTYITLGFLTGYVTDGPGNDLFLNEPGDGHEVADVWVSSDFGATFTYLGQAFGDQITEMDLGTIMYKGRVNAVKVEGLDNGGASPGFDLAYVEGLAGSSVATTPIPGALPLFASALGGLGFVGWRRKRSAEA
jgi:hypothetical protein